MPSKQHLKTVPYTDEPLWFDETSWMIQGDCNGFPPHWWDADSKHAIGNPGVGKDLDEYRQAKRICTGCPVQRRCLKYAVENHIGWNIWGGMDPGERIQFRIILRRRGLLSREANDA